MRRDVLGIRTLARLAEDEAEMSDLFVSIFLAAIVGSYDWEKTEQEIVERAYSIASLGVERLQSAEGLSIAKRE